jgi:hypothetical protein
VEVAKHCGCRREKQNQHNIQTATGREFKLCSFDRSFVTAERRPAAAKKIKLDANSPSSF